MGAAVAALIVGTGTSVHQAMEARTKNTLAARTGPNRVFCTSMLLPARLQSPLVDTEPQANVTSRGTPFGTRLVQES